MPKTRDNHYVPQWYQRGFFPDGADTLQFLDLKPEMFRQRDGSMKPGRCLFNWPPRKCFYKTDLYSTHFLFHVDDEIERRLFGDIDGRGSNAVRAFQNTDVSAWVEHFNDLFEYLDAQKLRTPKGLDWLQRHYPALDQNQLMYEMQGVRMMNITLWSECVREIVSAEHAEVKFILTDHPVTSYNHAVPPTDPRSAYPNDPPIAWKATQTIFPLSRDLCLILTNYEYAENPDLADPCAKRTNARNFRPALVRADDFIRARSLTSEQVEQINLVLKSRAKRYIAAGRTEWLYPETGATLDWAAIRHTLLPPAGEVSKFGGETFIGFEDGSVEYRDAFGRSEGRPDFLSTRRVPPPKTKSDPCGCGSGHPFGICCAKRPAELRPSWSELSIRERNMIHFNAITQIVGLADGLDWTEVRRSLTAEKIAELYRVFRALWPEDTDLISLLPKPDGRLRALFTGIIDPRALVEYAFGAANQFGEVLIQNPFIRDAHMPPEYSPIKNPAQYHLEAIKHVALMTELMPLIDAGMVNLFPDPCSFDPHLRGQMMQMATERSQLMHGSAKADIRSKWISDDDAHRALLFMPEDFHRASMREANPNITDADLERTLRLVRDSRHLDPLAPLNFEMFQASEKGSLLIAMNLAPNFELSLYLAQATGAVIVTDCPHRWREMKLASSRGSGRSSQLLQRLVAAIEREEHVYLGDARKIMLLRQKAKDGSYRSLISDIVRYVARGSAGSKPNWEAQLPGRLKRANDELRGAILALDPEALPARIKCIVPPAGIRDNTVDRLLLMTSVEHHTDSVPMAFFIERPDPTTYHRTFYSHPWER